MIYKKLYYTKLSTVSVKLKNIISNPHGIVLVTGPTGSGKSTTLYTVLNELNSDDVNIVTIEDPVEYTLDGINQVGLMSIFWTQKVKLFYAALLANNSH